jgi:hypothetical protein
MCSHHDCIADGVCAAEHECLAFFVQTIWRWNGFVAVRRGVQEAVVDGHVVWQSL